MNVWERIAMYILSCVFILSGVSKAINVPAFAYEVRMYSDAYLMDGIGYWSQPIAVLVCAMEILVGLLALRTRYMKICCIVMLLMLSFFVWLTSSCSESFFLAGNATVMVTARNKNDRIRNSYKKGYVSCV